MLAVASVSPTGRASDAALITSIRRLARDVELVLLCDQDHAVGLVKRMRAALPRHNIISLLITLDDGHPVRAELAVIGDLLNDGVLPVAVFPTDTAQPDLTAAMRSLAHRFKADEVLTIGRKGVLAVHGDALTGTPATTDPDPVGCTA